MANLASDAEDLGEMVGTPVDGRFSERSASGRRQQTSRRAAHRNSADLLAYTLKLANYSGIDLEQAYQEKMRRNVKRDGPTERVRCPVQ